MRFGLQEEEPMPSEKAKTHEMRAQCIILKDLDAISCSIK